jgi:hypothetical protein
VKVYVLTEEPYGIVLGVFLSRTHAEAFRPGAWQDFTDNFAAISQRAIGDTELRKFEHSDRLYILEIELVAGDDPLKKLAVAILEDDPVAMDVARDILRL